MGVTVVGEGGGYGEEGEGEEKEGDCEGGGGAVVVCFGVGLWNEKGGDVGWESGDDCWRRREWWGLVSWEESTRPLW